MEWFKFENMVNDQEQKVKVPVDTLCMKCGKAVHSWPNKSPDEVLALSRTCRKTKAQILLMGEIVDGKQTRDFNESVVQKTNTMGFEVAVKVALVNAERFAARLGMQPGSLSSTAMAQQVQHWINEEGDVEEGVVMKLDSVPSDLPYHKAKMYFRSESQWMELVMPPDKQLRQDQAKETFGWCNSHVLAERPQPLRLSNMSKVLSFDQWMEKVQETQQKRAALEAGIRNTTGDVESDEEKPRGAFTVAAPASLLPQKSSAKAGKAGQVRSNGSSSRRARKSEGRSASTVPSDVGGKSVMVEEDGTLVNDNNPSKRQRRAKDIDIMEILNGEWAPGRTTGPAINLVSSSRLNQQPGSSFS